MAQTPPLTGGGLSARTFQKLLHKPAPAATGQVEVKLHLFLKVLNTAQRVQGGNNSNLDWYRAETGLSRTFLLLSLSVFREHLQE